MLGNARDWKHICLKLNIVAVFKTKKHLIPLLFCLGLTIFDTNPAKATGEVLGVVKSEDNARQWSAITNRLDSAGVQYCVVEAENWQQELDFGAIKVLLLPNVEKFDGLQTLALKKWINGGGKVIATGPTGNLSQPEIRTELRSLLGAYWAYPLSSPESLELSDHNSLRWANKSQLEATFVGGAVLPAVNNSQTAATWQGESNPPAAIMTRNSTFLGWRWGVDAVASSKLDTAWLQAALNHYGVNTDNQPNQGINRQPIPCNSSNTISQTIPSGWQPVNPQSPLFPREIPLAVEETQTMTQELQGLISRFESTLLTADAQESNIDNSTSNVIEQLLSQKIDNSKQSSIKSIPSTQKDAHQALDQAKTKLNKFLELIEQGRYTQAKKQWLEAKRTLWDRYPVERRIAPSEVRAMWFDRGTIVKARSEADLVPIFDRMAKAGINTVFFETLNSGYTIYPSQIAPQQNPLVKGWDPLKVAIKLAHERNMELHAWVWTFATVNQRHNIILNLPPDYLGPVLSQHPDWGITDQNGNYFDYNSEKAFLDPANPEVKRYLSLLLEEIATDYDVDGIQLDYIRYPFQSASGHYNYGYGIAARQQFKQMTGVDPLNLTFGGPLWSQWTGFRIKQVDNFVAEISQRLKAKRPDLILSTAVFPMPRQERLEKIQQHWEEWVRQGWIDILVPMTYALDTDKLYQLTQPLSASFADKKTLLLPGIRLLNLPDIVAIDQMQLLRGMSTEGFALFAAENLNVSLENTLSLAHGNLEAEPTEPLPYRQPFAASWSRYQVLQKEWNFFISNHQIEIDELTLKEWGKEADNLAISLEKLADKSSTKNVLSAQRNLASLRRKFPRWMEQNKNISSYQVSVWTNRLETIDRLLNYGEIKH